PPVEPERIPISPKELEIPAEPEKPLMDEVITPLITRCDKGLETLWCAKLDPLTRFGSISVGRMFRGINGSDCVFQVPDTCSICLSPMHWPEKTQCGHSFHLRCLLRHLDMIGHTCPLCRTPNPLLPAETLYCAPEKWENDYWKGA
ncbi:hypothetical protein TNCV_1101201, partial [Trichonephila clavipes]